jgi:TRAP-type C4-dicarboxylate transport system permease small subunit
MSANLSSANNGYLGYLDRWIQPIEDAANMLAAIAIFILMLLGTAQIFLRSAFNSPIAGYIDLVELSMASMAFLGAAYCQRLGAHIRMEFLVGKLKGRWIWAAETVGTLVALFIIGVLILYGWDHFVRSYESGDTSIDAEYPVWPSKLLVPIAFALWFVRLLIQLAGSIRLFVDPALEPIGITLIHDAAETAREEIKEALGDKIDTPDSNPSDNNNGRTSS